ncbi:MAG TPA: hypothetical protein VFB45_26670 [Pseudolabrys sp.]|nr:hypothetical protein [Pseudolabrys sp.]
MTRISLISALLATFSVLALSTGGASAAMSISIHSSMSGIRMGSMSGGPRVNTPLCKGTHIPELRSRGANIRALNPQPLPPG